MNYSHRSDIFLRYITQRVVLCTIARFHSDFTICSVTFITYAFFLKCRTQPSIELHYKCMWFLSLLAWNFVACTSQNEDVSWVYDLDVVDVELSQMVYTSSEDVVVTPVLPLPEGDQLVFKWTINNLPVEETDSVLTATEFERGDVVSVTVYVVRGNHRSQNVYLSTTIVNSPPVGTMLISEDSLATNERLEITFDVVDADQDQLSIDLFWTEQISGRVQEGIILDPEFTMKLDLWIPTMILKDGYDTVVMTGDGVAIVDSPSEIVSVSIVPSHPKVTDTLYAAINTQDLDNDAVPIFYRWNVNGQPIEAQTLDGEYFQKGDVVFVEASITSDYTEVVQSDPIEILNTPPELDRAEFSTEMVQVGDILYCAPMDAYDVDGDPLVYLTQWYLNGVPQTNGSSFDLSLYGAVYSDVITCSIEAMDDESSSDIVVISLLVENTAPEIQSAMLSEANIYVNSSVVCIPGPTTDVDGQYNFIYTYSWRNGTDSVGNLPRINIGENYAVGDEVTCRVSASDGLDNGSDAISPAITVINRPPTASQVVIAPTTLYIDSELTCALLDYYDEDLNEDQSLVQWYVNGTLVHEEPSWTVYDAENEVSELNVGDEVTCTVIPSDGIVTLAPLSISKTVVNKPPEILVAYISPAQPASTSPANVFAVSRDVDGDEVTLGFDWYLNGQLVSNEPSLPAEILERGDQIQTVVTPYAGGQNGQGYVTEMVEVGNGYPFPAEPVIAPLGPREGVDDLHCSSLTTPSDPDGDPTTHTFSWQVNGNWTMYTVETIPATETQAGDVWVCLITATDAEGAARSASAYTLIRRPAPLWTQLYEFDHDMQLFATPISDSVPQVATVRDGQDCWSQQDVWSSLAIASFRSLSDLEAIEADFTVYSPDTKVDLTFWGFDFNYGGVSEYLSIWLTDDQGTEDSKMVWGDWVMPTTTSVNQSEVVLNAGYSIGMTHTVRVETDELLEQVSILLDGSVLYQGTDAEILNLNQPNFYVRSMRTSNVADVCWHDIKLYEGNP